MDFSGSGWGQVRGSCEDGDEFLHSVKVGNLLADKLSASQERSCSIKLVSLGWLVEVRGLIQLQSENFAFGFSCKEQCPKYDFWESKPGLRYYWFTRWTHRRVQQHWLGYISLCSINCLCGIRKFITSSQNLTNWPYNEPDPKAHLYTVFLLTLILIWFTHLYLCLPSFLLKLTFFINFKATSLHHVCHAPWVHHSDSGS